MNDPFVTYDTLTIATDLEGMADAKPAPEERPKLASILARLPRVPVTPPKPKVRQRFDEPEPAIPTAHLLDESEPPETAPSPGTLRAPLGDPTATIRIDTVTPYPYTGEAPTATPAGVKQPAPRFEEPATVPFIPNPATKPEAVTATPGPATILGDPIEDPWSARLLNLEATIQPYSRWIALTAVIAALGLTIVLLRGGGGAINASETAPQVSTDTLDQTLATTDLSPDSEAAPWLTPEPAAEQLPAIAVGPVSAPRSTAGRATLTGDLLPTETPRVADSTSTDPFPRTTR